MMELSIARIWNSMINQCFLKRPKFKNKQMNYPLSKLQLQKPSILNFQYQKSTLEKLTSACKNEMLNYLCLIFKIILIKTRFKITLASLSLLFQIFSFLRPILGLVHSDLQSLASLYLPYSLYLSVHPFWEQLMILYCLLLFLRQLLRAQGLMLLRLQRLLAWKALDQFH